MGQEYEKKSHFKPEYGDLVPEEILFSTERGTVFLMEAAFPLQKHASVNRYSYVS